MRLLTVLLFGVFLVATQVFLVLKAMQDNLFERDVDPVDAVMERQASISDELTRNACGSARTIRSGSASIPTSTRLKNSTPKAAIPA